MRKNILVTSLAAGAMALMAGQAWADCGDMGADRWNELSTNMASAFDGGDYEGAVKYGKQLTLICDESPIVNFTISESYRNLGNESESYAYVRRASEFLSKYTVPLKLQERIWFRRAEFDTPYKRELEKVKADALEDRQKYEQDFGSQIKLAGNIRQREIDQYELFQWTATGAAIAGGVIAAAGGALVGIYYGKADDEINKIATVKDGRSTGSIGTFNTQNQLVQTGAGLIAGGLVLGVAGTLAAIYAHIKLVEVSEQQTTLSFSVSPQSVGMALSF